MGLDNEDMDAQLHIAVFSVINLIQYLNNLLQATISIHKQPLGLILQCSRGFVHPLEPSRHIRSRQFFSANHLVIDETPLKNLRALVAY